MALRISSRRVWQNLRPRASHTQTLSTPRRRTLALFTEAQREEQRRNYQRDGFIQVDNLIPPEDIATMKKEIAKICRGEYGSIDGLLPVAPGSSDDDAMKRYLCFHHPHKMSPVLKQMMAHPNLVEVLTTIISPNVKTMQSMFFVKAAGKPGQAWHQDEIYIPTRDRSLCGAWIAIDDATIENGCLWLHPGSHKPGVLWPMRPHNDKRFDGAGESYDTGYEREGGVAAPVKSGGVLFFNGYTLHRSLPNVSKGFRRAYVNHYLSAESLLPWDCDGSIPKTDDNRDIIMVAGKDPYARKGYVTTNTFAFIRPDASEITDVEGRGALAAAMHNKEKAKKSA